MKKCKGCGAVLQNTNKKQAGYAPNIENDYCQRCYRIQHYNDVTVTYRKEIKADDVINMINQLPGLVFWVVDLFDFETGLIKGLNRKFLTRDIILVITKRDLIPASVRNDKIIHFVNQRLLEFGINVKGIVIVGDKGHDGIEYVYDAMEKFAIDKNVIFMGVANAGKSTLINALLQNESTLTVSYYPGTTLDVNTIDFNGYTIYDTPGIHYDDSAIFLLNDDQIKYINPFSVIRPKAFVENGNRSYALAGIARIDVYDCQKTSVVCYLSDRLPFHRGKVESAEQLWTKHYHELLSPTIGELNEFKKETYNQHLPALDVCIAGVGWLCIKGDYSKIEVYCNKELKITYRKAMI